MSLPLKLVLACGLLSGLVACDSSQDPLGPGTATLTAGCYTLTLGPWRPSSTADLPDALELTNELADDGDGRLLIQPLAGQAAWDIAEATWTTTGDLIFGGNLAGVRISLTGSESPFRGQAEVWSDVLVGDRKRPRATVTLESMACPE